MPKKHRMEDVVIVVPGILGSELTREGRAIWSTSTLGIVKALTSLGRSTEELELASVDPDHDDGIQPPRVLGDVALIPGMWRIDGYTYAARTLLEAFELTPGKNYFEFAYDWRRDNRRSAMILAADAHHALHEWRNSSGNPDAQLILIGHSMGGLVSRYFLEVLGGWKDTRMLITLGTPYRGAVEPLRCLTNGVRTGLGVFGPNLTKLVRSFPSVYQLVATWPCFDPGDGDLVRPHEWDSMPGVDPEKMSSAKRFHDEIATAVSANRRDPRWEEHAYKIHPVVGISQPTGQSARASGQVISVLQTIGGKRPGGDGSVSRYSAIPREMDPTMGSMYSPTQHAALQNCDGVLKHLEGLLTVSEKTNALFLGGDKVALGLEVPDFTRTEEPLRLGVEALGEAEGDLVAIVEDAMTGAEKSRTAIAAEPWEQTLTELPPPGEGTWRVRVVGEIDGDVEPNGGVFVSLDPE